MKKRYLQNLIILITEYLSGIILLISVTFCLVRRISRGLTAQGLTPKALN